MRRLLHVGPPPSLLLLPSSPSCSNRNWRCTSSRCNNFFSPSVPPQLELLRLGSLPSSQSESDPRNPNYDEEDDEYLLYEIDNNEELDEGVKIEIKNLGNNSRRIESSVEIAAPLDAVWKVLTDYEGLSDFIPSLSVSRLLLKSPNYARLFQIGEQNLGLGLKFNAKGILDCYEKQVEDSGSFLKREIDFEMVDGDFEIFQGKWSIIQQQQRQLIDERESRRMSVLCYMVDVKPKLWLPVGLVEGRLCNDISINLASIRQQVLKLKHTLP